MSLNGFGFGALTSFSLGSVGAGDEDEDTDLEEGEEVGGVLKGDSEAGMGLGIGS